MQIEVVRSGGFHVIGIATRTINAEGLAQQDIGKLWNAFFAQDIAAKIPNKINDELMCLYTDYEGDYTAPYTVIIGCKVSSADNIPQGLVAKYVPENNYVLLQPQGQLPQIVMAAWSAIHKSDLQRAYVCDFDVYGAKAQDPQNAQVDIYLSIKI